MKEDRYVFLIFFLFLLSCGTSESGDDTKLDPTQVGEKSMTYRIKPKNSGIDTFFQIEDQNILSIDTLPVSVDMPIKSVNRIVRAKGRYWIYSYSSSGVFVFDNFSKKGRQIAQRGDGPDGILLVSDLSFSPAKEKIFVVDPQLRKVNKYNLAGELERTIAVGNEVREMENWKGGKAFIREVNRGEESKNQIKVGSFDNGFETIILPGHIPPHSEGFSSNALSSYGGEVLYTAMTTSYTCSTWGWDSENEKFELIIELDLTDILSEEGNAETTFQLSGFWRVADSICLWQFSDSENSVYYYHHLKREYGKAFRTFSSGGFTADIVGMTADGNLLYTLNKRKSSFIDFLNWDKGFVPPSPMQTLYDTDDPVILEVKLE